MKKEKGIAENRRSLKIQRYRNKIGEYKEIKNFFFYFYICMKKEKGCGIIENHRSLKIQRYRNKIGKYKEIKDFFFYFYISMKMKESCDIAENRRRLKKDIEIRLGNIKR